MPVSTENNATSSQGNKMVEKLLMWEQLLPDIQELFLTTYATELPNSLVLSLNEMTNRALSSNAPSKHLYDFSMAKKKQKLVRILNQRIPEGILPKHFTANLFDIRVGGHGPDDAMYNQNADLRKLIARGTTIMSIEGNNCEENLDVVLYANKKFTGAVGDEDEAQPESDDIWRSYCLDNPDEADKVVAMEKLNGEVAHFSGRFIDGKFYIITGSKNVHMLISCAEDIDKYEGVRYDYAKLIARAVCKHLIQMQEKQRQILFNLLHHTKCTVVCEILLPNNQHIVNLANLKEPSLYVLSLTSTISDNADKSLTALPPHHCLKLFSSLGFTTASYEIIARKNINKFIKKSRDQVNKEGYVLYYLKSSDGYENTIGMAKTKTVWYVILRALREKAVYCFTAAKKKNGWSLQDRISSTHKRFKEIQGLLKFDNEHLTQWNKFSEDFLHWLNGEININSVLAENIRPQFPLLWDRFLANTGNQLSIVK